MPPTHAKILYKSVVSITLLLVTACSVSVGLAEKSSADSNSAEASMATHPNAPIEWTKVVIPSKSVPGENSSILLLQASENDHPRLPPILAFRCRQNALAAMINFHEVLPENARGMTITIDGSKAYTDSWGLTKDNDAALLDNGQTLAKAIASSTFLDIAVVTKKGQSFKGKFLVSGLKEMLAGFPSACRI